MKRWLYNDLFYCETNSFISNVFTIRMASQNGSDFVLTFESLSLIILELVRFTNINCVIFAAVYCITVNFGVSFVISLII